jgi:hypothetical protein
MPTTPEKQPSAEAGHRGVSPVLGSAAWLRDRADTWEKCGNLLGYHDPEEERHGRENIAGLCAAATRLEQLESRMATIRATWTQTPPTEQGEYWHWNGDEDCAPLPTFVLWSGTSGKSFVSRGQLGIEQPIDCDQYGGWWLPLYAPPLPDTKVSNECPGKTEDNRNERSNRRSNHGAAGSFDIALLRTINGNDYQWWLFCPSADRIAAYRSSGVRCRRFGDDLFVHVFDVEAAAKVDAQQNSPNNGENVGGGNRFPNHENHHISRWLRKFPLRARRPSDPPRLSEKLDRKER